MAGQRPIRAKNLRRISNAVMAKRYRELQRLREEIRKAEIGCARKTTRSAVCSNDSSLDQLISSEFDPDTRRCLTRPDAPGVLGGEARRA